MTLRILSPFVFSYVDIYIWITYLQCVGVVVAIRKIGLARGLRDSLEDVKHHIIVNVAQVQDAYPYRVSPMVRR